MRFSGYPAETLSFFRKLAKNNKKEWYEKHKADYQNQVVAPARLFVEAVNENPAFRKAELKCVEKNPLFRLHRDVRFSHDKLPYKTHNGICFSRKGTRKENGMFYLHLEPKNSFIGLGFWHPHPKLLASFRVWALENPALAKKMVKDLAKGGLSFDDSESLKRSPRGFEHVTDSELLSLLRLKNWIVSRAVSDKVVESAELVSECAQLCRAAMPLLKKLRPLHEKFLLENFDGGQGIDFG